MPSTVDLTPIFDFLPCRTPNAWLSAAVKSLPVLMIDHANCEKKAAATAMSLMHRYTDNTPLLNKMSRLAREELRHFEQVLKLMTQRGIAYESLTAARYAHTLRGEVRKKDPHKLVDTLIVGALIEARSCERFAALAPHVDDVLRDFYTSLLKSESRHFGDYISLAKGLEDASVVEDRLALFRSVEKELIESEDADMRFHSGVPTV
ncbi:MAG: tRNA isopentenyl-2-thiomethyl-A-37 hydroxylase MiaE [Pseudomonadota bacterium]|nr:tRNA isopentenyl-2-thiomethyl-A-37 hydroxylase MiaE [Pseudomonadota bacterium]